MENQPTESVKDQGTKPASTADAGPAAANTTATPPKEEKTTPEPGTKETGNPASPPANVDQLRDIFKRLQPALQGMIPAHLTPERVIKIAYLAISRSRDLMECTTASILQSVMAAAELGFELGGAQKFAHPVPFRNKHTGQRECILIIDYKGLIHLMKETSGVLDVEANVVYSNDQFDIQRGTHKSLTHIPVKEGDRGRKIGAYSIAYLEKGEPHFDYMTADEINAIRKRAKAGDTGPWGTDEDEMWKKTVTRRLSKYMISSIHGQANRKLAKALAIEDRTIMEGDANIVDLLDTETILKEAQRQPVKQPQRTSEVKPTATQAQETATNEDLKTRLQKRIAKLVMLGAGDPEKVLHEFSKFEKTDKKSGKKTGQFMAAESIEYLVARPKWAENVIRSMDKAIKDLEGPPTEREAGQEG